MMRIMKEGYGYLTQSGYMGWIGDRFQKFPTEGEYLEYISDWMEEIEEEEQSSSFFNSHFSQWL